MKVSKSRLKYKPSSLRCQKNAGGDFYVLVAILKKIEYNLNDNVGLSYINTSLKLHRKKY